MLQRLERELIPQDGVNALRCSKRDLHGLVAGFQLGVCKYLDEYAPALVAKRVDQRRSGTCSRQSCTGLERRERMQCRLNARRQSEHSLREIRGELLQHGTRGQSTGHRLKLGTNKYAKGRFERHFRQICQAQTLHPHFTHDA